MSDRIWRDRRDTPRPRITADLLNGGQEPWVCSRRVPGCRQVAPQPRCRSRAGSRTVVRSCRRPTPGVAQQRTALAQSRPALPGLLLPAPRERRPHAGDHRRRPAQGLPHRCRARRARAAAGPATRPSHPRRLPALARVGRPLAATLLGGGGRPRDLAGRWPSGWSATASRWWTCRPSWPPGAGAVSRAQSQERPRRRGLGRGRRQERPAAAAGWRRGPGDGPASLTKRREDLVAARTQIINRLHQLLVDLVPGGARRTSRPSAPPRCSPPSRPLVSRRPPAGSCPLT